MWTEKHPGRDLTWREGRNYAVRNFRLWKERKILSSAGWLSLWFNSRPKPYWNYTWAPQSESWVIRNNNNFFKKTQKQLYLKTWHWGRSRTGWLHYGKRVRKHSCLLPNTALWSFKALIKTGFVASTVAEDRGPMAMVTCCGCLVGDDTAGNATSRGRCL